MSFCGKHPTQGYKRFALLVDRGNETPGFEPHGGELGEVDEDDSDPSTGATA